MDEKVIIECVERVKAYLRGDQEYTAWLKVMVTPEILIGANEITKDYGVSIELDYKEYQIPDILIGMVYKIVGEIK